MNGRSLLERVQGLLQRTYAIEVPLGEIGRFVVGDAGYRLLYAGPAPGGVGPGSALSRARTLVRESSEGIRLAIYYPDALIRCLEAYPPQRGLHEANIDAFATFVEELDHLLCVAERAVAQRPVSLFELELHANVSKYLVLARFAAGRRGRLEPARRAWLKRRLFDLDFCDEDPRVRERYRDAVRWALRLLERLHELDPRQRLEALRRFHRADAPGKLELIGSLAA